MIHGVGTDILSRARFGAPEPDDPFIRRAYTQAERTEAEGRSDPNRWYCTRFAGKEAVFKALGMNPDLARLDEIEILSDVFGVPRVRLLGRMADFAARAGVTHVHLSLSWETEYAVAFAVAERAEQGGPIKL
ncbi:MAG: holo-ACP synthase [Oscillospiraceae bacterium]|nr:holo-ACP synthase [Oscillospiraceae bacterium]